MKSDIKRMILLTRWVLEPDVRIDSTDVTSGKDTAPVDRDDDCNPSLAPVDTAIGGWIWPAPIFRIQIILS